MRISDWSSDVCSASLLSAASTPETSASEPAVVMQPRSSARHPAERPPSPISSHRAAAGSTGASQPQCLPRRRGFGEFSGLRSEEHTSELQSLMRISYDVFCLTKQKNKHTDI